MDGGRMAGSPDAAFRLALAYLLAWLIIGAVTAPLWIWGMTR